eukprot:GILI01013186.1.p1 GENE.GILI01013186.1~~GILI01013186.1.p1  ORF type:complete len:335 (-),score=90.10 GILI01013186.1:52-1056(-)
MARPILFWISFGVALLIAAFSMIGSSVDTVSYLEYGVLFNGNSQRIDWSKVYQPGRYWVGLGYSFIKFPKNVQTIVFSDAYKNDVKKFGNKDNAVLYPSIQARTKEGIRIAMSVSFGYYLTSRNSDSIPSELQTIYSRFGTNYQEPLIRISQSVLRDAISNWDTFATFQNRSLVATSLAATLTTKLVQVNALVDDLQVLNFQFPSAFEDEIMRTEIAAQNIQLANYQKSAASINAQTNVLSVQYQNQIIALQANATAETVLADSQAKAAATTIRTDTETAAYRNLKSSLGFQDSANRSAASLLLSYIYLKTIKENKADRLLINVDVPRDINSGY